MKVRSAVMVNLVGTRSGDEGMSEMMEVCKRALATPCASLHWYGKGECRKGRKMGHITIVGDSSVQELLAVAQRFTSTTAVSMSATRPTLSTDPVVSVIMGSDSDLSVMKPCAEILERFGVPFELTVVSAHRTPARMFEFASVAHRRGVKVIIAAAGGAAHLPGMVAAITPLPVIGVPVALKYLDGVDSLHSIVQMPRGVPVATVRLSASWRCASRVGDNINESPFAGRHQQFDKRCASRRAHSGQP